MSAEILRGCAVLTMDEVSPWIEDGELEFDAQGGRLTYVGPRRLEPAEGVTDARGLLAMPGLVNAHTHAAMTLERGVADGLPLGAWLNAVWELERRADGADIRAGLRLALAEMIKSGTTAFADMYFYDEALVATVEESGMRAGLAFGLLPEVGLFDNASGGRTLTDTAQLAASCDGAGGGRVRTLLGPHAPYSCSPAYLREVVELAAKHGLALHTHVSETRGEVEACRNQHGVSPVELVEATGIFDQRCLAAHCVHVDERDIEILAGHPGVWAVHNPSSNLKLGSGIAPVPRMLAKGVRLALGTDGPASNDNLDMFDELSLVSVLHRGVQEDATVIDDLQALRAATVSGVRALGFDDVGVLAPGFQADLILLSLHAPHLVPMHSATALVVHSATGADVRSVYVAGRCLMRDRQLLTLDEEAVMEEARRRALALRS